MSLPQPQLHVNQSSINPNNGAKLAYNPPPLLNINNDSHLIRKSPSSNNISSPSSSSSSATSLVNAIATATATAQAAPPPSPNPPPQQQQHRHPVIIYTHSPKIIHTHPRDFMALVQKLTGMSPSDDHEASPKSAEDNNKGSNSKAAVVVSDDNESSSVVTEENCSGGVEGQVNSCFAPRPIFEAPPPPPPQLANPYLTNIPVAYRPNPTEFLFSNQPFYNYDDSFLFGAPNIHSLSSTHSTMKGINDFFDYTEY